MNINGNLTVKDLTLQEQLFYAIPTSYRAYGDSITAGTAASPGNGYADLLGVYYNLSLTNSGFSSRGAWICIKTANTVTNPGHKTFETAMFGFNDLNRGNANVKTRAKILNSYKAFWANHFLKTWVAGGGTSVVRTGSWNTGYDPSSVGGKSSSGAYTSTLNDYAEWTFTGTNVVFAGIGSDDIVNFYANFELFIDGVSQFTATESSQTDGIGDSVNNNQLGPVCWIITGLTDAQHTIRVQNKSTGGPLFTLDYFGQLVTASEGIPLMFYQVPLMDSTGYAAAGGGSATITNNFNTAFIADVATYPSDYPFFLVDTNGVGGYVLASGLSTDHIHPNNTGHAQLASIGEVTLPSNQLIPTASDGTLLNNGDLYFVKDSTPVKMMYEDFIYSTGLTKTPTALTADISTGKGGSQSIYGGVNASGSLAINSTSNATKGNTTIDTNYIFDGANKRVAFNANAVSSAKLFITGSSSPLHQDDMIQTLAATGQTGAIMLSKAVGGTNIFRIGTNGGISIGGSLVNYPFNGAHYWYDSATTTSYMDSVSSGASGSGYSFQMRTGSFNIRTGSSVSVVAADVTATSFIINEGGIAFSTRMESDNNANMFNLDGTNDRIGIGRAPTTDVLEVAGNLSLTTIGNKIKIATGSNASVGTSSAMVAGTITVTTTAVTSSSKIFLSTATAGGTQGFLSVGTIVDGTSFVINSSGASDTSTVNWWIIN